MTRPIFLYTGSCTGTMLARRLLETHPDVDACVLENLRVDLARQPGYTLALPIHDGGKLPDGEAFFSTLNTAWLRGEIPTPELLSYYTHWKANVQVDSPAGRPYNIVRASATHAARELFGAAAPVSKACRLFFHDHMRLAHLTGVHRALADVDVVTTLRHPLLTVVSILRRAGHEMPLWEFWSTFGQVYDLPNVVYFPIDVQRDADRLRRRLDLRPSVNFETACAKDVVVNRTSATPRRHDSPERNPDPELHAARRLLIEENRVHARLRGYWDYVRRQPWLRLYEAVGYDFAGY